MRRPRWLAPVMLALGLLLRGASAQTVVPPVQEDLDSIGLHVGGMRKQLDARADLRGLDAMTEPQLQVMRNALYQLTLSRAALLGISQRMPAGSDAVRRLTVFLQRWTEDALEDGLLAKADARDGLDSDLRQLARQYPDRSGGWRTLFPIFRP